MPALDLPLCHRMIGRAADMRHVLFVEPCRQLHRDVARPVVAAAENGERIRFTSAILPLWARRTKSLDTLLPVLYLRGISTGDFQEALAALLGQNAPNLSPAVISRLT